MEVAITVLIVIVSVLLITVVLIQNPKGGGMTSSAGGANQMFGVQKTTDFLEKATWGLAIILVVMSVFLNVSFESSSPIEDDAPVIEAPAANQEDGL